MRLALLFSLLSPTTPLLAAWIPRARSTQVVTDIDDTVKSSGGVTIGGVPLGGVDCSYERGAFYPGVFQFGLELASELEFKFECGFERERVVALPVADRTV